MCIYLFILIASNSSRIIEIQSRMSERAIELLGWASANPALHFQTWTRHVDPLLRQLGTRLPERIRDAAHARGRELSLEAALESARTVLRRPHEAPARAS